MEIIELGRKGTFIFENIYIIFVKIDTFFDVFLTTLCFRGKKQNHSSPKKPLSIKNRL
jgi:hypothetical protein